MKISFLVTYYNQEAFVRQSLDSILAIEKPGDWEILVGDDGSSDGTVKAVREYTEKDPDHIRLYVMPREAGRKYDPVRRASENRLNLVDRCTGDCFCTLDGDDWYFDTAFVREAAEVLEQHPEVTVVSFGYRYALNGELKEEMLLPEDAAGIVETERYVRGMYIHSGACVHRTAWPKERTAELRAFGSYDDNDIVMNGLRYGKMYQIRRAVYAYRQTEESIYNTMTPAEKAVLNTKGYDLGRMILGVEYTGALQDRYSAQLVLMYLHRKDLREILGEDRSARYLESCRAWKDSVCAGLLRWKELDGAERKAIRKVILQAARMQPVRCAKTAARKLLRKA